MNQKPLLGQKVAMLVANGFSEYDFIATQRHIQNLGCDTRIVSMDQGLVNSWNGAGWGLNFAADQALNTSLAADYDILVVPGGIKSAEKLRLTAHSRRFVNGFLETGKPVVALNDSVDLLVFTELASGRELVSDDAYKGLVEEKGGVVVDGELSVDKNLFSALLSEENSESIFEAITSFLLDANAQEAVAA